jgi:hypothetical protein
MGHPRMQEVPVSLRRTQNMKIVPKERIILLQNKHRISSEPYDFEFHSLLKVDE